MPVSLTGVRPASSSWGSDEIKPATREETFPIALASAVLGDEDDEGTTLWVGAIDERLRGGDIGLGEEDAGLDVV